MKVAILGFSDLPQSESLQVYRYFKAKDAEITAYYWGSPQLPDDIRSVQIEKDALIEGLDAYDKVVRGPAVHPRQIVGDVKVTSLTNIFMQHCPTRNVIGVTGTKGKGTTSTLVTKILEASGLKVHLGGNIGKPLLDDLGSIGPNDWVVLEMSAAQLLDIKQSPYIAVCLLVVPEHLDWHTDMAEYEHAKSNIFRFQREGDTAVYLGTNEIASHLGQRSKGQKIPFFIAPGARIRDDGMIIIGANDELLHKSEVKLLGEHNLQNVCAAITATWDVIDGDIQAVRMAIKNFRGLPYRIEQVAEVNGVKYINDSFSTTPETAIACIRSFQEPKIVILGGSDKGIPFDELASTVAQTNVKHVIAIGNTAQNIATLLQKNNFQNITLGLGTMKEIVAKAAEIAESGDVVLLSTGCASFGMFKDYKDRGDQFNVVVKAMK